MTDRTTCTTRRRAAAALRRWRRDESGGMIVFTLFIFVIMIIAGGLAVDFMRTETARTKLQTTIDRAVLAAADMDNTLDPEAVVRDYIAKAGLSEFIVDVDAGDGTALSRSVRVEARADVAMMFARMIGIDYLPAPATATAAEAITGAEIALVLDVSGSMSGQKLIDLKEAARLFVETIDTNLGEGATFHLIPYATQVSVPGGLLDLLTGFIRDHNYSNCVSFDDTDYLTTNLVNLLGLNQAQHFDPFLNWGGNEDAAIEPAFVCNPEPEAELTVMADDLGDITNQINALEAGGNTSIDVGVKWASALLDPTSGTLMSLFTTGLSGLANPVSAFNDPEVEKIIVVMTDGANTTEWQLTGINMNAWSDVYYDDARDEFWVRKDDTFDSDNDGNFNNDQWFSPRLKLARDNPNVWIWGEWNFWRGTDEWPYACAGGAGGCSIAGQTRQLTYGELFERVSLYHNAYYHHYIQRYNIADYNAWYWGLLSGPDTAQKNARLSAICQEAKDNGITVYTVGFEVTDGSALVMEDCASSTAHFFRVADGEDLRKAFGAIARQVTILGLTQ